MRSVPILLLCLLRNPCGTSWQPPTVAAPTPRLGLWRRRPRPVPARTFRSIREFSATSPSKDTEGSDDDPLWEEPEVPAGGDPPAAPVMPPARELSAGEAMAALKTSPRRILLSTVASLSIALAANFLGVTSRVLELLPESTVEATGLDTFYPRGDYKRVRGDDYTFLIPKGWVADTAVELAKAAQRSGTLDYRMAPRRRGGAAGSGVVPDAAYGPPGRLDARGVSSGDTNVSVVRSTLQPGFSLRGTLGSPTDAAETLLRVSLAPEGSGRTARLIDAFEDALRRVYQFEYDIDRGERGVPLRAISVIASVPDDILVTLTIVAPRTDWATPMEDQLRKIVSSFHLSL